MIKLLILIIFAFGGLGLLPACDESADENSGLGTDITLSGEENDTQPTNSDDPLKQLQDEGRLPSYGEGRKPPVLPASPSLSLYPVEVDRDQDGFPDALVVNHPEIKIDNCPGLFNPDQQDADGDGLGNVCDK